jgi:phospholipid/cholesterol/gamma-HCH transport system substrate-binding protein
MKNTLETRLGVFFALAVIAAVIVLELVGGLELLRSGYRVHALFKTVQELKVDDPVKLAGVKIGRVEGIQLTNNLVRVTMKINQGVTIRTDSKAAIRFAGLMGQNFVAVDFGEKGEPVDPSADALLITAEQPDLGEMMAKLDRAATGIENITKSFSGDQIDKLMGPLISFLEDANPKLSVILSNVQAVTTQIADGKGTMGRLIKEDGLYTSALSTITNFEAAAGEIKLTVSKANGIVDQVSAGQGTVGKLVKDETLYRETTSAITNLREIMQKVNQGQGFASQLLNDTNLFPNMKVTLQKVEKATESLEDQGPLTVLGIAVGRLF